MISHRSPSVEPSGLAAMSGNMHPSYGLHAIAQNMNAQHAAVQAAAWDQQMAQNPYGHVRPHYRT